MIEACAFLLGGVGFPLAAVGRGEDPICLSCQSRCRLVRPIARFAMAAHDHLVSDIEGRTFTGLPVYPPPASDDEPQLSVRLLACPSCGQTNVVTVNKIAWVPDRNTGRKLDIRPLVNQLMITPQEAEQLKQAIKQMVENRQAAQAIESEPEAAGQAGAENGVVRADPEVDREQDIPNLRSPSE